MKTTFLVRIDALHIIIMTWYTATQLTNRIVSSFLSSTHPYVFSLICLIRSSYWSFQKVSQDCEGKSLGYNTIQYNASIREKPLIYDPKHFIQIELRLISLFSLLFRIILVYLSIIYIYIYVYIYIYLPHTPWNDYVLEDHLVLPIKAYNVCQNLLAN